MIGGNQPTRDIFNRFTYNLTVLSPTRNQHFIHSMANTTTTDDGETERDDISSAILLIIVIGGVLAIIGLMYIAWRCGGEHERKRQLSNASQQGTDVVGVEMEVFSSPQNGANIWSPHSAHTPQSASSFSPTRFDLPWRRRSQKPTFGCAELQGRRPTMEDKTIMIENLEIQELADSALHPQQWYGVYDGHSGPSASVYLHEFLHKAVCTAIGVRASSLKEQIGETSHDNKAEEFKSSVKEALREACLKVDNQFLEAMGHTQAGSTATTALILGSNLFCANVGDSRTILCRQGKPIAMSQDHKPTREDEHNRILAAGGFVFNHRVMGQLAVSRSFGDEQYKQSISELCESEVDLESMRQSATDLSAPLVIAEPEIRYRQLMPGQDDFLLLACDGLFDVMSNEEVCDFLMGELRKHNNPERAAASIATHAITRLGSRDNVSVIVVMLKPKIT